MDQVVPTGSSQATVTWGHWTSQTDDKWNNKVIGCLRCCKEQFAAAPPALSFQGFLDQALGV